MWNKFAFAISGMAVLATISITGDGVYADISRSHASRHKFSDVFLAIKPGDEVTFINRDGVTHKVVSVTPAYRVDVGELQPGTNRSLVFNRKGVVDLGCSMHPEMKMTVFVRTPPKPAGSDEVDNSAVRATINLLSTS